MKNNDVIYFSVNNWFCGRDYPDTPAFNKWLGDDLKQTFMDDAWAKENKLCIRHGCIDMSFNYVVSAPREWVEKNCPELLSDGEYTYTLISCGKDGEKRTDYPKKYSDFVFEPEEDGSAPEDNWGWPFLDYCEENFGSQWYEDPSYYDDYDDDEDDEDDEYEDNE